MIKGRKLIFSIIAAAILGLSLPVIAAAQGGYGYPDYRRDSDRDRNYEDYDQYGRYGRYDSRYLRDSIRRLDRLSKDFANDLDREIDHSRENGSRHEDHLNADAKDFRRAVSDLKNRFDERNLDRSANEAQRVLDTASHLEDVSSHHFYNGRLASEWSQISQELRVIADAYGTYGSDRGERRRRNDDYRNGDYRRNDDYRRRNRNNDWWRRILFP
jgi:hypothetical protein